MEIEIEVDFFINRIEVEMMLGDYEKGGYFSLHYDSSLNCILWGIDGGTKYIYAPK